MKKRTLLLLVVIVVVGVAAAINWVDDGELTVPPPRGSDKTALRPSVSTVAIPLRVSLSDIQRIIDEKLPHDLYQFDRVAKRVKCFGSRTNEAGETQRTQCLDLAIKGRIRRNGPVDVLPAGEELEVRVPVEGRARARGTSGLLKMVKKTGQGAFTASFYLKPGVGNDGRLDLAVRSDFTWDVPLHTRVLGQTIDLSGAVDKVMRKGLGKVERKVSGIAGDHTRWGNKAREAYRQLQRPLKLNDEPEVWMLVEPQSLLVADMVFIDRNMLLPLALRTALRTHVGAPPEFSISDDMPPVVKTEEIMPDFSLDLPLVLAYDALRSELGSRVLGTRIPVADWLPGAAIVIRGLHLYPSGSRLVVGVEFETRGIIDWLSAEGSVFLAGTPEFDNDTKLLSVPDLEFTRRTGNSLFDFSSYLFAKPLRKLLRTNSIFDLSGSYTETVNEANAALNRDYGEGLSLRGKLDRLAIADIRVLREDLVVFVQAHGSVEAVSVGRDGP